MIELMREITFSICADDTTKSRNGRPHEKLQNLDTFVSSIDDTP